MFLFDSFSCRKTEPNWFGILRCAFAFILTYIIVRYSIVNDFNRIFQEANVLVYDIPQGSNLMLNTSICANDAMEVYIRNFPLTGLNSQNIAPVTGKRCVSTYLEFAILKSALNKEFSRIWVDVKFPLNDIYNSTINNNQLDDIINSYSDMPNEFYSSILPNKSLKLTLNMTIDILNTENIKCVSKNPRAFYFTPGQAFFIRITPSVFSYLINCEIELGLQSEQLPLNLDPNIIGFGIFIYYPYRYNSVNTYDFTTYLSDIGGFYGTIEGIFTFFFGSEKLGPWGMAHIFVLSSIPCIRSFGRNLARKYVTPAGIPLVEKVNKRPGKSEDLNKDLNKDLNSLEERVQILETLLKEYYLDDYYLDKIKYFADNRKIIMEKVTDEEENK